MNWTYGNKLSRFWEDDTLKSLEIWRDIQFSVHPTQKNIWNERYS